jgi:hypothetical protein
LAVKDFSVRLGQEEVGRILNLKANLDLKELLVTYAPHYQKLGWVLVGMKASDGTPLAMNLNQPAELWSSKITDLGVDDVQINIGVRTGKVSNLLVLEVDKGEGALALDQWGDWRAHCLAEVGGCREQHYYALPAGSQTPPSFFLAPQVLIYGEGGLVLAPPSLEPQAREPWRWLRPPWETPPQPPQPAVWQFLKDQIPAAMVQPEVPAWSEIYRMIAAHGPLLQALLVAAASQEEYYEKILHTALSLELNDPALLLGLLWHAPHGEDRHNPDKLDYFHELVARIRDRQAGVDPLPGLQPLPAERPWSEQPAPAPETPFPAPQLNSDLPEMHAGAGPTGPGLPEKEAPSTPRLDQSVSRHFFQLLAGLGEKVIMESCRHEAMLTGLKDQMGEIDHLVSHWEQQFGRSSPTPATPGAKPAENPGEFSFHALLDQYAYRKRQLQEIQTAANDFLQQNPDLAEDRHKVQMVIFCLKNYISLNPDYAGLPFREKLDQAGIMAREILSGQEEL